jgi:histidine phosphotransferase ChpT
MTADNDLLLAELLCARICHDLAGPVGAAAAGAELIEDGGADEETMGLVAASAAGASARLRFFRTAMGPAGKPQPAAALRDLCEAYLKTAVSGASSGLMLDWRVEPAEVDGDCARLLLNLVLIGRDSLPRGGTVALDATAGRARMAARGAPAILADEAHAVLVDNMPPAGPRGAHAVFVRKLAERVAGGLTVAAVTGEVVLEADSVLRAK